MSNRWAAGVDAAEAALRSVVYNDARRAVEAQTFAGVQSCPANEKLQAGMLETAKLGVRQGHHGGKHAAAAARYVKVVEFLSTNPYAQGRGIKVALRSTYTQTVRRMMANDVRELFLNLIGRLRSIFLAAREYDAEAFPRQKITRGTAQYIANEEVAQISPLSTVLLSLGKSSYSSFENLAEALTKVVERKRAHAPKLPLLFIMDANAVYRSERFLEKLRDLDISFVSVPSGMTATLQPRQRQAQAALRSALSDQRGNCLAEAMPMLPKCAQQASVESFKTRIDVVLDAMHRLHRSNITAGFSLMRAAYEKAIEDDLVPRLAAAAQCNMDYSPPQEVEPDAPIPLELMIERHKKHFELRKLAELEAALSSHGQEGHQGDV